MPKLLERRNWEAWEKDGGRDIFKVAEKKVLDMVAQVPDKLLSADAEDQIDEIIRQASLFSLAQLAVYQQGAEVPECLGHIFCNLESMPGIKLVQAPQG